MVLDGFINRPKKYISVCMWCSHYDPKHKDCDVKGGIIIREAWKPARCRQYEGPEVNDESLASLRELFPYDF
jgi:hypothetical protein